MTDFNPTEPNANVNVVDRAAQSADKALEATRRAAGVAIDRDRKSVCRERVYGRV